MVLSDLRARATAQVRGMAIQNRDIKSPPGGVTTTGKHSSTSASGSLTADIAGDASNGSSGLFKLTSWVRIGVRKRFRFLDVVLNCVLLTPLAVLFQVAASGIQDFFFLNHVPGYVGTIILLSLGITIEFCCSYWQQYLSRVRYVKDRSPDDVAYVITTRMYHFAVGFANVCHYRGLSDVYYYFLGYGAYSAVQAIATSLAILLSLRCARNVLGPPLCVGVDSGIDDFFQTSTLYRTKEDVRLKHLADNAATVLFVTSLCFLHWISVWALFDCVIFPENSVISVITSWIIGYVIIFVAFVLEPAAIRISRALDARGRAGKTLFEDMFLVASNCGVILVWRGHWMFFEGLMYYFPIYHNGVDISAFYGLFSAFMMMCLLNVSSTLILKGCDYDGDLADGQGVTFGVDYFALHFTDAIEEEELLEAEERKKNEEEERMRQEKTTQNNNLAKQKTSTQNQQASKQKLA